jgi:hypothetical protein
MPREEAQVYSGAAHFGERPRVFSVAGLGGCCVARTVFSMDDFGPASGVAARAESLASAGAVSLCWM